MFGGSVGIISALDDDYLSLNNFKSNVILNSKSIGSESKVSDIVGALWVYGDSHLSFNNIIGNVIYDKTALKNGTINAIIGDIGDSDSEGIIINSVKSSLNYTKNDLVTVKKVLFGVKPYIFFKKDYSNLSYYEKDNKTYATQVSNATRVAFSDRFDLHDHRIPTLKNSPEVYSDYYEDYSINVGETKTVYDLILNDNGHYKLSLYKSFKCTLDECSKVTDETIVSLSNENNNYYFTGLKPGTTTLIIFDEISGYLNYVNINVIDNISPVVDDISGGLDLKATTQELKLKCSDNIDVTAYYWGTEAPNDASSIVMTADDDLN